MREANVGDKVTVHYTGKLESGEVFGSSVDREPLEFKLGDREFLSGFEDSVIGMKAGESKTVTLQPEQAFGNRRDDLVLELPKSEFPEHIEPVVGLQLQLTNDTGAVINAVVTDVGDELVTIDGNHPLAGQTVVFDIELVGIE